MPLRNRINQVGSLDSQVEVVSIGPIGGSNLIGGATPVAANATTDYIVATAPNRALVLRGQISYVGTQVASPGTILASVWKRRGATVTQLTNTVDVVALAPNTGGSFVPLSTNSEVQNAIELGDILFVRFVSNNATISQQPANLSVGVALAALS